MQIALIKDKQVVQMNNIVVNGDTIPDFLAAEGWQQVTMKTDSKIGEDYQTFDHYENSFSNGVVTQKAIFKELEFEAYKALKEKQLSNSFRSDIAWTDDLFLKHQKIRASETNTKPDDKQFTAIINYYGGARLERARNKAAFEKAENNNEMCAVKYNPTHVISKDDIEKNLID